jgi:hypothetical protein
MNVRIRIEGNDISDIENALNEIKRQLQNDMLCGFDKNDTRSYSFCFLDKGHTMITINKEIIQAIKEVN